MLEWMHDDDIVHNLHTDFSNKTAGDCESFIESASTLEEIREKVARDESADLHLAIEDEGKYMGTTSLKHIGDGVAEFAIVLHPDALGHGIACSAMMEIFDIGHRLLGLEKIYWCVDMDNRRAVKFYDKMISRADTDIEHMSRHDMPKHLLDYYSDDKGDDIIWYVSKGIDN